MEAFDEGLSDASRYQWKVILSDGHLNFSDASKSIIEKQVPKPFGDGRKYTKYVDALDSHLTDLVEKGVLHKKIYNGDFLDTIQTEGISEIHNELRDYVENGGELSTPAKDYVKLMGKIKKGVDDGHTVFIVGNHDDPKKLDELKIDHQVTYSDDLMDVEHGDRHDKILHDLHLHRGGFLQYFMSREVPHKSRLYRPVMEMKKAMRVFGLGVIVVDQLVKKGTHKVYSFFNKDDWQREVDKGLEKLTKQPGKYSLLGYQNAKQQRMLKHKDDDKIMVLGHDHRPYLGKGGGVVLGDLYRYGPSFVGGDEKNVYVLMGIIGPKDIFEAGKEVNPKQPFKLGHMWQYSWDTHLSDGNWKFIGKVKGENYLESLKNPLSVSPTYEKIMSEEIFEPSYIEPLLADKIKA